MNRVHDVRGQAHGAGVVGDGAGDGLAYPPRRVGGETVSHLGVELLDGAYEPGVALLNEILEGDSPAAVSLGYRDYEPEVGLDQTPTRPLVSVVDAPRKLALLPRLQQPSAAQISQITRKALL